MAKTNSIEKIVGKLEEWRDVVNYEGFYQVSDWGRMKRLAFTHKGRSGSLVPQKERIMTGTVIKGHVSVQLYREGRFIRTGIHRLVLEAFVGPCPEGMEGCHNNGDGLNNNLENLRWDTHEKNQQDMVRHGHSQKGVFNPLLQGENHCQSKLSNSQVKRIKELFKTGNILKKELAKIFGVHSTTIGRIINGIDWKSVK